MKIGFEYIFVIFAFIAIIMLSSCGSSIVVPYQKDDLFSKQFKYEGMENPEDANAKEKKSETSTTKGNESLSLSDSITKMMQPKTEKMLSGPKVNGNTVAPKESFEGMYSFSPYDFNASPPSLDRLSNLSGGANCNPSRAAGYSNSKGPLCMDEPTLLLLRTRGGNQSGAPSQIGQ